MAKPWEKYASPRGIPIGPQDPTQEYRGPKAEADLRAAYAGMANDATRLDLDRARLALAQQQAAMQAQADKVKNDQLAREAEAKDAYNPAQLETVRNDAMNKLETIKRIGTNYQDSALPAVGWGAETVSQMGGTNAANIATALEELKAGSALSEVMKMTQATGKNPFTPMSNSDVDLISRNVASVNQRQSPNDFFSALNPYIKSYQRAYAGAVGAETLNSEITRQAEKYTRENPNATPAQRQRFMQVLQTESRKRYEAEMRRRQISGAAPRPGTTNAPRKPAAGVKFLGFE